MEKRIYLSSPTIHGDEQKFIQEAFDTNWVAPLGPNVNEFEKEMAKYMRVKAAAALSAGTAAIHMMLKMVDVQQDDIVFVSDLTFSATCNPICYEKGKPVFIDCERDTWNMDPEALKKAFEKYPNPKAVVCVHLYGTPAKIDELKAICDAHNVPFLEDAAESLGASYKGRMTGTFGEFGVISFNGNKIITTSGGGMLLSDNEEAIQRTRFLSTQARDPARHYQHSQIGYNYRMSNIVAGIGRGQLLHLEEHISLKKAIYEKYKKAFAGIKEIHMNPLNPDGEANYWLSCATIDSDSAVTTNDVMDALEAANIESRPIWKPMHLQPVFEDCDFFTLREAGESNGEDIFTRGFCLPSDIKNTDEDMALIISIVRKCFGK